MKNLFLTLFGLILLYSCEKEIEPVLVEDVYEFQNVKYFLTEGDKIEIDTIPVDSREFLNNSTATASLIIDVPDQTETSQFISNEDLPFKLQVNEAIKISVPTHIDEGEIYTSAPVWNYAEVIKETLPSSVSGYYNNFTITPYTKLTVKVNAIWQKISTSYIATYKEQTTGKLLEIEGKWKGSQLNGFSTIVIYDGIYN